MSKSISYRTSHIEYLDILKTNDFFVFFRRTFQKFSVNSEKSPKIQKTHEPKASTTATAPKVTALSIHSTMAVAAEPNNSAQFIK